MASYDKLSAWRFRVKILRAHSYYSMFGFVPIWSYILADEDGTRIDFTVFGSSVDRLAHVEALEDKWVEIFGVRVDLASVGFRTTNSEFTLTPTHYTRVQPIDPLNDWHFLEFREIGQISQIRNRTFPIDVMGVVSKVEACFENPAAPKVVFYIRDSTENEIKCIATGNHAYRFQDGLEIARGWGDVIVVLKMWRIHRYIGYFDDDRWFQTKGGLSDFSFNPHLPEVGEFKQSLLRSGSDVRGDGVTRP